MPEPFVLTLLLAMFLAVALLSVLARWLHASSPIVMLVAGVGLALLPGVPPITLNPDLTLLALLPPLLYYSGVGMSWRGFRANLRPILSLAIGCVLFTATVVAAVTHYLLGLDWAVGFVLGAIVSPPDSVAPASLRRRFKLPRRMLTILEGESLVNDATALVAFSLAVRAVETGHFSALDALARFLVIVVGETAFGVAMGYFVLWLRNAVNDPRAEILVALATPYLAFWPPHELGGSGVVACFTVGMFVSWHGRNYIRPATRLQGFFIWDLVSWCVEALTFFICGLQCREIVARLASEGWPELIKAGLVVSVVVIVVRFLWVFPVTYLPRWLWPPLRKREPLPELASALSRRLRRTARRGEPRGGAVDSADRARRPVPASRPHPVRHDLRDRGDAGRAGRGAGAADEMARSRPRRRARDGGRRARRDGRPRGGARRGARTPRRAGARPACAPLRRLGFAQAARGAAGEIPRRSGARPVQRRGRRRRACGST